MLFRMVSKRDFFYRNFTRRFRAVLFRMVSKPEKSHVARAIVLELCCFEWFQNQAELAFLLLGVLELCCFEWFQNEPTDTEKHAAVLELCCFEWFQNSKL